MSIRTDIHRPAVINPADYEFVAFEYLRIDDIGSAMFLMEERAKIRAHMGLTDGRYSAHEHGGNCHVCGSVNAIYTALFYHKKTNTYIRTGLDCTEKLDRAVNGDVFRKKVTTALEARAGVRKAKAFLESKGVGAAWTIYQAEKDRDAAYRLACQKWQQDNPESNRRHDKSGGVIGYPQWVPAPYQENTITDIVGKLIHYGSVSDKQIAFLAALVDQVTRRPEIEAERAAQNLLRKDFPNTGDKRVEVVGKVVSVKTYEDSFRNYAKVLVEHADGWRVFGKRPAGMLGCQRGDTVSFRAILQRSDNDTKFGFFRFPTVAKIMESANNG